MAMGDLDQQEKQVSKKIKPLVPIKVHNAKTCLDVL